MSMGELRKVDKDFVEKKYLIHKEQIWNKLQSAKDRESVICS